ncbi:phage holin family protein [Aeromicrobium terrae]|uniref:Phage holin family protein n=1 Tax=Aeromicrobium terrae TaxID=2498846 RepID=A0A5C8NKR8_9ACTN|nr:phage holin family protein [Aeromicrobium terrae]TXL61475.1 phage holin family protein [Aeromicrobium terrae]
MSDQQTADASLGELISRLSEQSSRLIRDELALAKTELQKSAKHAGVGAGLFGGSGFIAMLGVITLVGSAVAALSLVVDVWLATLVVAVALFAIAGIVALAGKKQVGEVGPPEQAIENVRKDLAEVKEHRS